MNKLPFTNIEKFICSMFKKENGIFMRNGTTALWVLFKALGFKGKKIVVPVNVCYVVPLAIFLSGNEPYFVDIDENFTIDLLELKKINPHEVHAVVLPYMYGSAANVEEILKICKINNWILIEDVAQSLGAKIGPQYAGSFCDYAIASFGMGKVVDIDYGGMLCLNSQELAKEAFAIYQDLSPLGGKTFLSREYFSRFYFMLVDCIEAGEEMHLFGIPLAETFKGCFIGNIDADLSFVAKLESKLTHLQDELDIREKNAKDFQTLLKHENIRPLKHKNGSTYWRQNIMVKDDREGLLKYLKANKVKASKYFPSIDSLFYQRNGKTFPRSDRMTMQAINLWPSKETSREDIVRINELICRFYAEKSSRNSLKN